MRNSIRELDDRSHRDPDFMHRIQPKELAPKIEIEVDNSQDHKDQAQPFLIPKESL